MLPFTAEQFFDVFARYNHAVWPAPLTAYALGAIAVAAALRGGRTGGLMVAGVLALFWLWTGVAYHWLAFAAINPAAWLFGALFVIEAVLLVWFGVGRAPLNWGRRAGANSAVGFLLIGYAAVLYPALGYVAGHTYPRMPMFGITPCPVTIFTLGMLLLVPMPPWNVLIIPVIWSLIGGTAAFLLHVPQDWMLLLSGPLAVVLIWRRKSAL